MKKETLIVISLIVIIARIYMPIDNMIYHREWDNEWDSGMKFILPQKSIFYANAIKNYILREYWWFLRHKSKIKILDLGCGNGDLLIEVYNNLKNETFSGYNIEYYGVDISMTAIRSVRKKFLGVGNQNNFKRASVLDVPFVNKNFDIIIFSDVMDHISDKVHCTMELRRLLKDGGLLLFGTIGPNFRSLFELCFIGEIFGVVPFMAHSPLYFISPDNMKYMLKNNDFRDVEIKRTIGLDHTVIINRVIISALKLIGSIITFPFPSPGFISPILGINLKDYNSTMIIDEKIFYSSKYKETAHGTINNIMSFFLDDYLYLGSARG